MKFIKFAKGSSDKFHMKWPLMQDPLFQFFDIIIETTRQVVENQTETTIYNL